IVRAASASTLLANRSSGSISFEIVSGADGKLQVRGALTFATARRAREEGMRVFTASEAHELEVDCRGITASDSAGLTVLLDRLARATKPGRALAVLDMTQ